jgi:hypothetical protein
MQVAALDITHSEFRRSVFSGNEMQVGTFALVKADCSTGPLVDIRMVKQPANGKASFQEVQTVVDLKKDSVRAHCNGKSVDAVAMFYTANEDFTGPDKLEIEVDYKNGFVRRYSIVVNVR